MRVYVESNYLLEIVRQQEQSEPALDLLALARTRQLELAVPSFSLAETYWTLRKDSDKRKGYLGALSEEMSQLRRSSDRGHIAATADRLIEELRTVEFEEPLALDELVTELCRIGRVLSLDAEVVRGAAGIAVQTALTMQDAFVLSSILRDLAGNPPHGPCAFVSRDRKAFGNSLVVGRLQESNCTYIPTFDDTLAFVRARLVP
jgi:predicted nucleic acid-binding protein